MVNKRSVFTFLVSVCLAAAPVIAQTTGGGEPAEGQCSVCQTVAATITACSANDTTCVCTGDNIANVAACISCVTDSALDTTAVEGYDVVEGYPETCAASDGNSTSTTTSAASTTSQSRTTSSSTSTTGTAPGSTVTAPPPGNGAMALTGGAGVLTAMLALAIGIAL